MDSMIVDKEALTNRLSGLSVWHQAAFVASFCERLLPDYEAFALIEGWGDYGVLRHALDEIWRFAGGASFPTDYLRKLLDACDAGIPGSEDFPSVFAGLGRNAGAAVCYALEYCITHDTSQVVECAQLPFDSIDLYLGVVADPVLGVHTSDPKLYEWISDSPMALSEYSKQQSDLQVLTSHPTLDMQLLDGLRRSSARLGIHPITRGLIKGP